MSERVLRILLSELTRVRLCCKNDGCGTTFEMALTDLAKRSYESCPVCKKPLVAFPKNEHCYGLDDLAKAIAFLNGQGALEVEFVLPDDTE